MKSAPLSRELTDTNKTDLEKQLIKQTQFVFHKADEVCQVKEIS
jgi:hypothetical protein